MKVKLTCKDCEAENDVEIDLSKPTRAPLMEGLENRHSVYVNCPNCFREQIVEVPHDD